MNGPCSQFTVPTGHKSDCVPNADFIIYAAAGPSNTESMAVWAATCNTWGDLRPSIGAMNFDPKYMTDTAWSVRVAAHEIAHALGFSKDSIEGNSIETKRKIVRGNHRRMVAGKHVREKTKAHFVCKSLEGMELEDEGGTREKAIPHWKGRHARDELMAPTVGAGYYTALTMAVFADMGYYRVNWSMAEPMSWGSRSGCDFLVNKCNTTDNLAAKYPHMFCDAKDTETLRCTSDRRHVGTCTATIVEDKGSPADKDVCPVVSLEFQEISSGTTYRTCSDENVDYLPGSLTGGGSWCLDAELLERKDDDGHKSVKGVCAQVSCDGGTVKVKYLGSSGFQPCPEDTDIPVTLKYFQKDGKIDCPTYGEVCTIAAKGSSLVIPSALVGGHGDEQEEEAEESAVASGSPSPEDTRPQLSPVASGASIEKEPPGASAAGVAGGGLHAGPRGDPGVRTESEDNTQRRGRRYGSGSDGANRASGPTLFFSPSPGEDVAGAEGDPRADCPAVVPSASAPATPIPSVNGVDFQAIPDALVQQADSDGGVADATAGLIPFVFLVVVAAAVVVVPL
ncbi:surface protease GP63 [Trypanosoma cruzi]|nr:surface protease GP63 [Trypanosoma cruzi]